MKSIEVDLETYEYRETYLFGEAFHKLLCRFVDEGKLFRFGLAKEHEFKLTATAYYSPGDPGTPSSIPERYDPPTGEELEYLKVFISETGEDFELSEERLEEISKELMKIGQEQLDYDRDNYDMDF